MKINFFLFEIIRLMLILALYFIYFITDITRPMTSSMLLQSQWFDVLIFNLLQLSAVIGVLLRISYRTLNRVSYVFGSVCMCVCLCVCWFYMYPYQFIWNISIHRNSLKYTHDLQSFLDRVYRHFCLLWTNLCV